jgi:predicted transposase YbfD/YdcC
MPRSFESNKAIILLAVKGNQPTWHAAVESVFTEAWKSNLANFSWDGDASREVGPGRWEQRCVTVLYDPQGLPPDWPDVAAVIEGNRERETEGKQETSTPSYWSSYAGTAAEMAQIVRGHWGIENQLHWVLDVVFGEDDSRVRAGHAGANWAMVRKVAVSLLRRASGKESLVTKRWKAGWDEDFLLVILQAFPPNIVR